MKSLIFPSNIALLFLAAGILAGLFTSRRRLSWLLLALSGLITLAFSSGIVATLLMSPLEYAHPALSDPALHPQIEKMVVLTGHAEDHPLMPLSAKLNDSSAFRVLEAANIHRLRPDLEVIVSGGEVNARIMKEQLSALLIPGHKLSIEDQSKNTAQSAENLSGVIKQDPFYLVTSAGHMPRAMGAFRKQGMHPVPVPTDYKRPKNIRDAKIWPSPTQLYHSNLAIHEYAGILWYRLTGRI